MGRLKKLNIGHNLDFSISQLVNRNSYWGHENFKIILPSVFNCLINFFSQKIKVRGFNILSTYARQHTSYTYLEITTKNQLLEVIKKFKIKNRSNLVLLQNQSVFLEQKDFGFAQPKK